jgi:hypothetical protein
MTKTSCQSCDRDAACVTKSRSAAWSRAGLSRRPSHETPRSRLRARSKALPLVAALALVLVSATAVARGGGGGGHGGGHGGGGHGGHGSGHGGASVGGAHVGSRYGGHLYLGPSLVWGPSAHWGSGFWVWDANAGMSGGGGWGWNAGSWWVSPAYPGWVWMGEPWVWDGSQWLSQGGYWTTADMGEEEKQEPIAEAVAAPADAHTIDVEARPARQGASRDIYRYTDAAGVIHFTDSPPANVQGHVYVHGDGETR